MQPTMITGFSDDVELGEIGEIKKSSVVVMRVTVDGGIEAAHGVHWRGVALTKFDGKRWYNDAHEPTTLTSPAEGGWFRLNPEDAHAPITGRPIHYTVLLEPIGSISTGILRKRRRKASAGDFIDDCRQGAPLPRPAAHLPFARLHRFRVVPIPHSYSRLEYRS